MELQEHLRECDECQVHLANRSQTRDLAARAGRVEMPAALKARLRAFLVGDLTTRGRVMSTQGQKEETMPDDFEYISRARLEFQGGYRRAYLGEVPEPVVYGVQGALRDYYGVKEGPPIASTLDHIVAAVAG